LTNHELWCIISLALDDASRLNIGGAENLVEVTSRRGSIKVKARASENIPLGVVFMTFHFKESAVNLLTHDALDPIAKIPGYKVCAVRISKIT